MTYISNTGCCGIYELRGVSDNSAKEIMLYFCQQRLDTQGIKIPLIFFTDVIRVIVPKDSGQAFERLILENKLGTVTRSEVRINPNTRRKIAGFMWSVDYKKLIEWYAKNK